MIETTSAFPVLCKQKKKIRYQATFSRITLKSELPLLILSITVKSLSLLLSLEVIFLREKNNLKYCAGIDRNFPGFLFLPREVMLFWVYKNDKKNNT